MKNVETTKKIEENKLKLENFSKLIYLKKRWGEEKLNIAQLKEYNKWTTDEKYKVIVIELKLEHYLTTNIIFDLNGIDNLFKPENREMSFEKKLIEVKLKKDETFFCLCNKGGEESVSMKI